MHRLFVAIDLPIEVRDRINGICRDLPGARWVPTDQLHLTLRFIGEVDDAVFTAIREALATVRGRAFAAAVQGVGHFPPGKHPRVLWVGFVGAEALLSLQDSIERTVVAAGIPPEGRKFSPHITLARLKETPAGKVEAFEARCRTMASDPFPVTEFHLYSSTLSNKGALHRREASYPLF